MGWGGGAEVSAGWARRLRQRVAIDVGFGVGDGLGGGRASGVGW